MLKISLISLLTSLLGSHVCFAAINLNDIRCELILGKAGRTQPEPAPRLKLEWATRGTILQVRDVIRTGIDKDDHLNSLPIITSPHIGDVAMKILEGDGSQLAFPGDLLEIQEAPKKASNQVNTAVVKHLESGAVGKVYWNWLMLSTNVIAHGEEYIKPVKPPTYLKFPNSFSFESFEKGATLYQRPMAKVGEFVWIGNTSRRMSVTSVGRLKEITDRPSLNGPAQSHQVVIDLVDGSTVEENAANTMPLEPDEVEDFIQWHAAKIKVDWFKLP